MSSALIAIKRFFVNEFSCDSSHNIVLQVEHLTEEMIAEIEKILPFIEKDLSNNVIPVTEKI